MGFDITAEKNIKILQKLSTYFALFVIGVLFSVPGKKPLIPISYFQTKLIVAGFLFLAGFNVILRLTSFLDKNVEGGENESDR